MSDFHFFFSKAHFSNGVGKTGFPCVLSGRPFENCDLRKRRGFYIVSCSTPCITISFFFSKMICWSFIFGGKKDLCHVLMVDFMYMCP